jgi:hypothetical protein
MRGGGAQRPDPLDTASFVRDLEHQQQKAKEAPLPRPTVARQRHKPRGEKLRIFGDLLAPELADSKLYLTSQTKCSTLCRLCHLQLLIIVQGSNPSIRSQHLYPRMGNWFGSTELTRLAHTNMEALLFVGGILRFLRNWMIVARSGPIGSPLIRGPWPAWSTQSVERNA